MKLKNNLLFWGLILIPLVLLILPPSFFDKGQSVCLSKVLLNKECIGCGLTRATQHFIHFEFYKALKFNKLVVIVVPLAVYIWTKQLVITYRKIKN